MSEPEANGHRSERDLRDLAQENAQLRKELSELKYRQSCDREALCKLLGGGKPLSLEDVQNRIASGDPLRDLLLEIEQALKEDEAGLREAMSNPIPFHMVREDLEGRLGAAHGR